MHFPPFNTDYGENHRQSTRLRLVGSPWLPAPGCPPTPRDLEHKHLYDNIQPVASPRLGGGWVAARWQLGGGWSSRPRTPDPPPGAQGRTRRSAGVGAATVGADGARSRANEPQGTGSPGRSSQFLSPFHLHVGRLRVFTPLNAAKPSNFLKAKCAALPGHRSMSDRRLKLTTVGIRPRTSK